MSELAVKDYIVVLITAPKEDEAVKIARELVGSGLAACVNIVKNVRSIYKWQGEIQDDPEVLMIAKTRKERFEDLSKKVQELHSYEVPEIIELPITAGSVKYLKWLEDTISAKEA